jgi:hypothetical protein
MPLFSSEVFLAPCIFKGVFLIHETRCLFFLLEVFWSQWARGLIACLYSWLHCLAQKPLLNTVLTLLAISTGSSCFGERSFYYCFEIYRLCLVKNLTLLWASPVRKRVWALKAIVWCYYYDECLFIVHETFALYKFKLNKITMNTICIPGMLQHPALGIWKEVRTRSRLFHDHVRPNPFGLQFAGALGARAPQKNQIACVELS